jgi:hypothetical protein
MVVFAEGASMTYRIVWTALLLAACGAEAELGPPVQTETPIEDPVVEPEPEPAEPVVPVTYHQHIAPILEARCNSCHTADGIGPFQLETYDQAVMCGDLSAHSIETRSMPPFPPDDSDCRELLDPRKMEDDERELFRAWVEQGFPEGDPEAGPEVTLDVPPDLLGDADRYFGDIRYEPQISDIDEYRCFHIDPGLTWWSQDPWLFLKSVGIRTDNWARVHHAIVYAVGEEQRGTIEWLDGLDRRPGYNCFFGAGVEGAIPIGGYSPGAQARPYPGDTTIPIGPGTQFIVEVHFHETFNTDPVRLSVASWLWDTPIEHYPDALPFFDANFFIPAGAPSITAEMEGEFVGIDDTPVYDPDPSGTQQAREGNIWSVDFHMHLRGKTAKVDLVRADGTRECLLYVPDWTDDWQGTYFFKEPIRAYEGDRIEAVCEWDNTAARQPVVDGVRLEPEDLTWGFDALDEMCNGSVGLTAP